MSLQFDVEEFIRPLVSALYESSEEDMEVDLTSVIATEQEQDADSDIEVIGCYREASIHPPQLVAGRAMTFDLGTCGEERTQPLYRPSGSIGSTLDPSDSLIDWFTGSPPSQTYTANDLNHHMANCSRIEPITYSPTSPPLIDQRPSGNVGNNQWSGELQQADSWMSNLHITGLAKSVCGLCGEPNYIQRGDCTVCGKSFATIQEEITLGYLEKTPL